MEVITEAEENITEDELIIYRPVILHQPYGAGIGCPERPYCARAIKKTEVLTEAEEKITEEELIIYRPPLIHYQPYPWLVMTDEEGENERLTFYSISENRYYIRLVPELHNTNIYCCYREWLLLKDKSTFECSLLNMFTRETLQFPVLDIPEYRHCVLFYDDGWQIFLVEISMQTARYCKFGDREFVQRNLKIGDRYHDRIQTAIYRNGKLYALTWFYYLAVADITNCRDIKFTCVINGEPIEDLVEMNGYKRFYLVESCGEILLVFVNFWKDRVVAMKVFKADFDRKEWLRIDRIGDDRVIFVDCLNGFSSSASPYGLKGNCIYIVQLFSRSMYVYDIEDQSITLSVPCPKVKTDSHLFWMSVPN